MVKSYGLLQSNMARLFCLEIEGVIVVKSHLEIIKCILRHVKESLEEEGDIGHMMLNECQKEFCKTRIELISALNQKSNLTMN